VRRIKLQNYIVISEGVKTGERINLTVFRRNDGVRFTIRYIASPSVFFQTGYQSELQQKQKTNKQTNKSAIFARNDLIERVLKRKR